MKTFKQYLTEETQEFEDFIVERCHYLQSELDADLDDLEDLPLYRGIDISGDSEKIKLLVNGLSTTCLIKTVRMNRQPLDTHAQIADIVDDMFEQKFGWRPRSQSVFCYGKHGRSLTEDYGELHRIYPIGPFKFVWGSVVDMTGAIYRIMRERKIKKLQRRESYDKETLADIYEAISDELEDKYQDSDLHAAITGAPREIMIGCKKYLAVPV